MFRSIACKPHLLTARIILWLGMVFLLQLCFGQEPLAKPEHYTGVAVGTGGPMAAKSIGFDLRITKYTSDEEVEKYMTILRESGQDALRRALEKEDRGQLSPTGFVGNAIAAARKRKDGANTIITIVTARIMSFVELYRGARTADYQFGFMQLTLNAKGEGTGQIMAAANIKFNKKKEIYEIESFGNQYIKATNVRTEK